MCQTAVTGAISRSWKPQRKLERHGSMRALASRTLSSCSRSDQIKTSSLRPFPPSFQAVRSQESSSHNEAITAVITGTTGLSRSISNLLLQDRFAPSCNSSKRACNTIPASLEENRNGCAPFWDPMHLPEQSSSVSLTRLPFLGLSDSIWALFEQPACRRRRRRNSS